MPSSASPEGYFPTNDNRASSVTTANTPPSKEESVAAIHAAAITYDPAFLANIAPHLNSPDPDVRAAAAEGIVVLGDSAGSALLRQAAKTARSGEEAAELREKADYLELPSATPDLLRKMKALNGRRAAGRQLAIPPALNSTMQSTRP